MNDKRLSYRLIKPNGTPDDYFQKAVVEHRDRQLGYELLKAISDGGTYTVSVKRKIHPQQTDGIAYELQTTLYMGKVNPVYMELKPAPKLGFWQRVKVLVTGDVPLVIMERK